MTDVMVVMSMVMMVCLVLMALCTLTLCHIYQVSGLGRGGPQLVNCAVNTGQDKITKCYCC